MCLNTNWPIPRYAFKDIKVWKRLDYAGNSPYYNMQYKPNTGYSSKLKLRISSDHSVFRVDEGLHAYAIKPHEGWFDRNIVEMTIPKGSWYFKGQDDNIASNKLITGDRTAL